MPRSTITTTPTAGDGSTVAFTLSAGVLNEDVYVDRIHQKPTTDYSISGATLTFVTAPPAASVIEVYADAVGLLSTGTRVASRTGFSTAATIINRTAVQCGLASVADPYASTDPNFVQLCELLNASADDLLSAHEWTHLITTSTFSTSGSATYYALPADWDRMIDQTEWNRTSRLPMLGPVTGQEQEFLIARLSGTLFQVAYRIQGNTITFPTAPSNSQTLAFEYVSNYWAWPSAQSAPTASGATAATDTVLFDPELIIAALRLSFLDAKGFDTLSAERRYKQKLEVTIAKNVGGRTLNLGGIGINADHLIDAENMPVTGYAT